MQYDISYELALTIDPLHRVKKIHSLFGLPCVGFDVLHHRKLIVFRASTPVSALSLWRAVGNPLASDTDP
jgi:hypothetical protein